jgi:hypothetical protein
LEGQVWLLAIVVRNQVLNKKFNIKKFRKLSFSLWLNYA